MGTGHRSDNVRPGNSPPESPLVSPRPSFASANPIAATEATSVTATQALSQKPLPDAPFTPLTPSRAPSKAAKLLGDTTDSATLGVSNPAPSTAKHVLANLLRTGNAGRSRPHGRKGHYRPLPDSTLTEIQRFFGEVPRDVKVTRTRQTACARSHPAKAPRGVTDAAAGRASDKETSVSLWAQSGGEESGMWADVDKEDTEEDEEESASLSSDRGTSSDSTRQHSKTSGSAIRVETGIDEADGFRSVLQSRKQWCKSTLEIKEERPQVTKATLAQKKGRVELPKVYESFLDLGLEDQKDKREDKAQAGSRIKVDRSTTRDECGRCSIEDGDRSGARVRPGVAAAGRNISNPVLISSSTPLTAGRNLYVPRPTTRSVSTPHIPKCDAPPKSTSPPRPKHRPPPLDLRHIPPPKDIPIAIAIAHSPTGSWRPQRSESDLTIATRGQRGGTRPLVQHGHSYSLDSPLSGLLSGRPVPPDLPGSAGSDRIFLDLDNELEGDRNHDLQLPPHLATRERHIPGAGPAASNLRSPIGSTCAGPAASAPKTPFKHLRRAPVPMPISAKAGRLLDCKVFPMPIFHRQDNTDLTPTTNNHVDVYCGRSSTERYESHDNLDPYGGGDVSYFEPVTPTAPTSNFGLGLGVGIGVLRAKAGGGWFKRVAGR